MDERDIDEWVRFSQEHSWNPQFSGSLVRRFLTELISSQDLIFEINDQKGRVAVGVRFRMGLR